MVPTGDLERIELERAEALDDGHDAGRLGGQRPGRRQEVADGQEAPRDGATDRQGFGHTPIVRGRTSRTLMGGPPQRTSHRRLRGNAASSPAGPGAGRVGDQRDGRAGRHMLAGLSLDLVDERAEDRAGPADVVLGQSSLRVSQLVAETGARADSLDRVAEIGELLGRPLDRDRGARHRGGHRKQGATSPSPCTQAVPHVGGRRRVEVGGLTGDRNAVAEPLIAVEAVRVERRLLPCPVGPECALAPLLGSLPAQARDHRGRDRRRRSANAEPPESLAAGAVVENQMLPSDPGPDPAGEAGRRLGCSW